MQTRHSLRIAACIAIAACSPPPQGGRAVQIKPDVHNLFRDTPLYAPPPDRRVAALWVEQPEPARTEIAKWIDEAGTQLVLVVIHGAAMDRACTPPDADAYGAQMIESVVRSISTRDQHRVVVVVEPHLLTTLMALPATPACDAAAAATQRLVSSAIGRLSLRGVSVYLDGGGAELVRTAGERDKLARIIKNIADRAGGTDKLRGFAIGVDSHASLADQIEYTHHLEGALVKAGVLDKFFIIDRPDARVAPAPGIDAYFPLSR